MHRIEKNKGVFVAPSQKETGKWGVWVSMPARDLPNSEEVWFAMEGDAFATREEAIAEASKCKQFGRDVQTEIDSL